MRLTTLLRRLLGVTQMYVKQVEMGLSSNGCGWVEARSAGRRGVLAVHLTGGGRGAPWRDIVGAE